MNISFHISDPFKKEKVDLQAAMLKLTVTCGFLDLLTGLALILGSPIDRVARNIHLQFFHSTRKRTILQIYWFNIFNATLCPRAKKLDTVGLEPAPLAGSLLNKIFFQQITHLPRQ